MKKKPPDTKSQDLVLNVHTVTKNLNYDNSEKKTLGYSENSLLIHQDELGWAMSSNICRSYQSYYKTY